MRGIPITLEVPTHVKLTIVDQYYWLNGNFVRSASSIEPVPVRDVKVDLIKTKKIFTVDMKRPAAGTIDAKAAFKNQYFDNLEYNVDDQTIEDINAALTGILQQVPALGRAFATTAQPQTGDGTEPEVFESVVATAVFEVDDPALELKMGEFLRSASGLPRAPMTAPPPVHPPLILAPSIAPVVEPAGVVEVPVDASPAPVGPSALSEAP